MSQTSAPRLTADQLVALRFAAHRQLARWSNRPALSPHQHAQRTALRRAAQILQHDAFARGCELHPPAPEARTDA